jgi:ATP diphosphatase
VPEALPALQRAHRLNDRAARAGFDWPEAALVRLKVAEELAEMDEHLPGYDRRTAAPERRARLKAEMGDVLLALANLARHLGFSAEEALSEANDRFVRRFGYLEDALARESLRPEDVGPDRLEALWAESKEKEAG